MERLQLRRGARHPRAVRVRCSRAHPDQAFVCRLHGAPRSRHRDGAQLHDVARRHGQLLQSGEAAGRLDPNVQRLGRAHRAGAGALVRQGVHGEVLGHRQDPVPELPRVCGPVWHGAEEPQRPGYLDRGGQDPAASCGSGVPSIRPFCSAIPSSPSTSR